ncbi:MAG TPA: aldehyde dehydrogenase family protein [Planctomycetota bacterium]|nr:aldehyde dehydrogenase family protein [Planctomycetota bacterium]
MSDRHLPALRLGSPYESLDTNTVVDHRDGRELIKVSVVNAGVIRRDLSKFATARETLRKIPTHRLLELCAKAGDLFMTASLPLGSGSQSPEEYVRDLSASSGLPQVMVRRNMGKVEYVFKNMATILRGLTRGLDLSVFDEGVGTQAGSPVSFYPLTHALGVVLPSNSPGVNSLWMPSIALKIPVVLKPGREEPWTPWRIIQAFIAAGVPKEAFGFYPADHDGAAAILEGCPRALLFGDQSTTARWASNPGVQIHGPGYSKTLIGADRVERWREDLDVIVASIADNGGRSCVNASAVITPKYGREIAQALAEKLGPIAPLKADDPGARLSSFANPKMAEWIDESIEEGLRTPGGEDVTAKFRNGPRKVLFEGGTYLRPTIIWCDSMSHPLANREFLFPFASVVEVPEGEMLERIGHSLVVTALTDNPTFTDALLTSPLIDRLNIGAVPTTQVAWDQPHEGNLFEFLYRQRAILVRKPGAAGVGASGA